MTDFGTRLIKVVVGGLLAYIISSLLITALVTGTSSADNLIQTVLPIVIAAGAVVGVIVASFRNTD